MERRRGKKLEKGDEYAKCAITEHALAVVPAADELANVQVNDNTVVRRELERRKGVCFSKNETALVSHAGRITICLSVDDVIGVRRYFVLCKFPVTKMQLFFGTMSVL